MNSYRTIKATSEGLFKDKGSKFISFAFPVSTAEEAMEIVSQKRQEFFDARHVCYAYMLGAAQEEFRSNDDGEPSGTAGRPILGQILSAELTDILIVVIRYFGGILLGTSGLINAYKTAAAEAISAAEIIEVELEAEVIVRCSYDSLGYVMRAVKDYNVRIVEQFQQHDCRMRFSCKQRHLEGFLGFLGKDHTLEVELVESEQA